MEKGRESDAGFLFIFAFFHFGAVLRLVLGLPMYVSVFCYFLAPSCYVDV